MIEVDRLTKRYGRTTAVRDLSFDVPAGTVTGFLGPNGAGKSTTMRCVLGLDTPTSGRATVAGRSYRRTRYPMHEVGALLDAGAVHGGRTARNHLLCLAQSNRIGARRVSEVLDEVGLSDAGDKRVKGFSLGMKQRLGIAAAMLGDPPVLLFDEPINGLDPEGIHWVRGYLRGLAAQGRTVLVSSHLMSEMAQTADHVVIVGRGELIAQMPTADLIARSDANHVVVRTPTPQRMAEVLTVAGAQIRECDPGALAVYGIDAATIGETAASHGLVLHELSPQLSSLEQVFMELTENHVEYRSAQPQREEER